MATWQTRGRFSQQKARLNRRAVLLSHDMHMLSQRLLDSLLPDADLSAFCFLKEYLDIELLFSYVCSRPAYPVAQTQQRDLMNACLPFH